MRSIRSLVPPKEESLEDEVEHIEQECRMVLPGIQALFGFQLNAVFNQAFKLELSDFEQRIHLLALLGSALATLCVMAPAAYHRLAEPGRLSRDLALLGTRMLAFGMFFLLCGICLDVFVVATVIISGKNLDGRHSWSLLIALGLLVAFFSLWFIYPLWVRRRRTGP